MGESPAWQPLSPRSAYAPPDGARREAHLGQQTGDATALALPGAADHQPSQRPLFHPLEAMMTLFLAVLAVVPLVVPIVWLWRETSGGLT